MADSKYIQQFKKGLFETILLCLIAKKETYEYETITELNETDGKVFGYAKEDTICPMLYRLQDTGLVQCRTASSQTNGGPEKYYSLTAKGQEALHKLISFWRSYTIRVDSFTDIVKDLEA